MINVNTFIFNVLKGDKIFYRPHASPGLWLSFLLPIAVITSYLQGKHSSEVYKFSFVYSFNIILNVFYLLFNIYKYKSINVTKNVNILYGVIFSIAIFFYNYFLNVGFRTSACYTIANALIYFEGLPFILKVFPCTFTYGEANIAIQGFSLFTFNLFLKLNSTANKSNSLTEDDISSSILLLVISWILIFCLAPFIFKNFRNAKAIYPWGFSIIGMIVWSNNYFLGYNIFQWIWQFLTKPERIGIIFIWLICSILAFAIIQHHINTKMKSNTIIRKFFHFVIVVVYLPGVLFDADLLYFSSGCVFGLFIVLEAFRILKLPPFYKFLQEGFLIYCDSKDSGILALTPICLLVGMSLPLWLHPTKTFTKEDCLPALSGVISVGIGDTFASMGGNFFGNHKWKGSNKTIEGTLFCFFSQIIFILLITFLGFLPFSIMMYVKSILAITISSFIEAKTDQIDNIVLPLTTYILLML